MATHLTANSEVLDQARPPVLAPLGEPLIARYKSRFFAQGTDRAAVKECTRSVEIARMQRAKGRYASVGYQKVIAVCRRAVESRLRFRGGKTG